MANTQDISLVKGGENITQRNARGGIDKNATTTFVPYTPNTAITPEALQPQTPIVPATPATPTAAPALDGQISATTDAYNQNLINKQNQAETAKNAALADYTKAQAAQQGITTLQGQAEKNAGLDQVQSDLTDINNQILAERNALNHQLAAVDQNSQGGTRTQIEGQKAFLNQQSLSRQADLAIIQYAAQNKFDNVKAIADRQAALQFEQQQNNLDALKTTYEDYKDVFTTAEQRAFTSAQADRQAELDQKKADYTQMQNTKIQLLQQAQLNNAPVSVLSAIQSAPDAQSAISAAGQYGVDTLDRQAKLANIAQSYASANASSLSARKSLIDLANAGDPTAITQLGFDPTDANSAEKVANVQAYGQQYASTGKLPSPAELKQSGLTVSDVTNFAKQSPKPDGALVSTDTGVTPSNLSAAQQTGIQSLSEIVTQTIPALKDKFSKLNAGITGKIGSYIYTTQDRQDYNTLRQDFLSKLLLARSGAAVSEQEYERLSNLVPTDMANAGLGGLSNKGGKALNSLESSMKETLNSQLKNNNLAIYGYSTVNVPSLGQKKVGEIVNIGGTQYRVLPDGNLTDIIQ